MNPILDFDGTADAFRNLAVSLNGKLDREVLWINGHELKGSIKRIELEPGLYLVYWSLDILQDYMFIYKGSDNSRKFYFLNYFFEAQFEHISPPRGKVLRSRNYFPCTTLYLNTLDLSYVYKSGRSIRCLCLIFSDEWVMEQAKVDQTSAMLQRTFRESPEAAHIFSTSATEQLLSGRLTKELTEGPSWLSMKAYSYNLLDVFLNYSLPAINWVSTPRPYTAVLIEVEKKILASMTGTLPSIDELADEFYISSSTLKRQFKLHYGKTIYDYYLYRKMLLARDILEKGKSTVTNVATNLGYENVSHFTAMFKKQFGIYPHEVNKEKRNI